MRTEAITHHRKPVCVTPLMDMLHTTACSFIHYALSSLPLRSAPNKTPPDANHPNIHFFNKDFFTCLRKYDVF